MSDTERWEFANQDASEQPDAIVIRPERSTYMVYDFLTGRVVDTETGESFGTRYEMRSGGIHAAGIKAADGSPVYEYELKIGSSFNPDKTRKRVVWQVFWARRGNWMTRFVPIEMGLGKAQESAEREAQNDSLDRLAQFLRAQHELSYEQSGRSVEGELVIVDRRMDDTSGERAW